jgi:hypothetical protein
VGKGTDFAEAVLAILLGIVGGIILLVVLAALFAKKEYCPSCNAEISRNMSKCPQCGSEIRWD